MVPIGTIQSIQSPFSWNREVTEPNAAEPSMQVPLQGKKLYQLLKGLIIVEK